MKKGFTLIELLAVIIILAVVALIATPIVLDVVKDTKESAAKSQAYMILDAAKLYYAESMFDADKKGAINSLRNIYDEIIMNGKKPENGQLYVNNKNLTAMAVLINNKCYKKEFAGELEITDTELCEMEVPMVDEINPEIKQTATILPNEKGWYKEELYVTVEVTDYESGAAGYYRCVSTSECTPEEILYTNQNTSLNDNGDNVICVIGVDKFGNKSTKNCQTYKLDKVVPILTANGINEVTVGDSVEVRTLFNEPVYGVSGGSVSCNPINTSGLSVGNQTVTCTATSNSGLSTTTTKSINVVKDEFLKTYGGSNNDNGMSMIPTTDGGYVSIGYTQSNNGDITTGNKGEYDILVMKADKNGNKVWVKTYGGTGTDLGQAIIQASDGGYILIGLSNSNDGDITGNKGGQDIVVIKLDSNGNKVWVKTYGGSNYDSGLSIVATTDNGYIITGITQSTDGDIIENKGSEDVFILKIDSNGNKVWVKTYGGTGVDRGQSIIATSDGGYILTGYTASTNGDIPANTGSGDILVIKLDANGNKVWVKIYGGTKGDYGNSIIQTSEGYIITGNAESSDGDITTGNKGYSDAIIIKIDSNGNKIWVKTYGGSSNDYGYSIIALNDGGYVVSGMTMSNNGDITENKGGQDILVMKLNSTGNKEWIKTYGGTGNERGQTIYQTSNGVYVLFGQTSSTNGDITSGNKGLTDFLIMKFYN